MWGNRERRSNLATIMKPHRSLGTVLFTDIVGSTERATELGDRAWGEVLEKHHARVRGELRRFGGHEIATAGDGFLVVFDEPRQAIVCAWAVRDAVREIGVGIRCGVHMGAVDHAVGHVGGIGVHIAARVMGEADADEILVTQTVHDAEEGSGFVFEDRGTRQLKGVSGEWRLFAVESVPDSVSPRPLDVWFNRLAKRRRALVGGVALVLLLLLAGVYARPGSEADEDNGQSIFEPPVVTHRQVTFTGEAWLSAASSDGKTIAYSSRSGDKWGLYVQDLAGGKPLELGRYDFVHRIRWSPTGETLLVLVRPTPSEGLLLLFPRLGGSPRELGGFSVFAWSPDGRQFVSGTLAKKRLWFRDVSTGDTTAVALPDSFTWLQDIDWSPRGDRIAYLTQEEPSLFTIWTIGIRGEAAHRIVQETQERILSLRWSKTGEGIYFLRTSGDAAELVKVGVSPRTGEPSSPPMVVLPGLAAYDFDLFEGNRRILYTRSKEFSNLWLVEPSASGDAEVTQLTSGTAGKWNPSVSPDGQEIAFQMNTGPVSNIHVLVLEGGAMKQVTYLQSGAECPAWSPDGSEIAFRSREGNKARVWTVAADGGTPQPLSATDVGTTQCLTWAPGDKILYPRPGNRSFHQLDPDTGEESPLVSNEDIGWMFWPHYSPSGTKVAVSWNRRPDSGIWVISLIDSEQTRIGGEDSSTGLLGWSPDGEWIYGSRWNSNTSQIIRYSIADHSAEVVATFKCGTYVGLISMSPDARRFVCVGHEDQFDLWIAENAMLAGGVGR